MKKSRKPAGNRKGAWLVQEKEFGARHFGGAFTDRLDLEENSYGLAGRMLIETGFAVEEVTDYARSLDEETGIIRVTFAWKGHPIEILTFASRQEDLVYYEISADSICLNLHVSFCPDRKSVYINYNMGGFYFQGKNRKAVLIGKGELKADGFPKADEEGIHIKNASRAAFRIYLKSEAPEKEKKASAQAMEMQMAMNRYLARTDDISREGFLRIQEKKEV